MTFYRRLGEGLPERRSPPRDAFQADPKALRRWIEELPLANSAVASRMLFQALREMNQMTIDPSTRLAALEALRVPITGVTDAIDRQVVGASFPVPPPKAQLATLGRDLQRQLALGFRLAVYEFCAPDGKVPFLRGKAVALALERAIGHLGEELCKGYLVYAAPPESVWRMMNALFAFALASRLDDKAVDGPVSGTSGTPRQAFTHALLMAVSNPYRLTQKEIHETAQATRGWAAKAVLRGAVPGEAVFAVPLDEDRGPGYLPEERSSSGAARLALDTAPLQEELERQLANAEGAACGLPVAGRAGNAAMISADLVRRLLVNWRFVPERAQRRLPAGHELDTLVGLHAVHYFLAGGLDFETVLRRACGTAVHATERQRGSARSPHEAGRVDLLRARVLDQGLGGCRVAWEQGDAVRARVGEIVALAVARTDLDPTAVPHDERDWMLGVIRWLRVDAGGMVDAGVEIIGREARAAVVRALDSRRHPRPSLRGVVLQAPRMRGGHAASIVAPAVLERNAPGYEYRALPSRWGVEEVEVGELRTIEVAEQTSAFLRIVLPAAERDPDTPARPAAVSQSSIAAS